MKAVNKRTLYILNLYLVLVLSFANYTKGIAQSEISTLSEEQALIVAFNKTVPANGAVIPMPDSTYHVLAWTDALIPETDRYEYCIDQTNNDTCDNNTWVPRINLYSGAPNEFSIAPNKTYYWQVRVRDANVYANAGTWWSFSTMNVVAPTLNKITPADGAIVPMPADTYYLLQWTDLLLPDTDAYQYCVDTSNNNTCNTSWITRPNLYSGGPGEFPLEYGTTYYWQVKARDAGTQADGGTWWSFTTSGSAPAFGKTTPADGADFVGIPNTYYLLQWSDLFLPASDAYQYCIDTSNNNTCNTSWVTRPNLYSGGPEEFPLAYGTTYYWQVRSRDSLVYADGGTWWSFSISGSAPTLNKTTPANGVVIPMPETSYYLLQWTDLQLPDTDRYQYCIDTTNNNSCDGNVWVDRKGLFSGGLGDITLVYGTTYYWQVKARDAGTQADGGTWWSFTIQALAPVPNVVSIVRISPNPDNTNAASVDYTVTFSQSVTGVDESDFYLVTPIGDAFVIGVSGSGNSYTVSVNTGTDVGSFPLQLNFADDDSVQNIETTPVGGVGFGNGDFAGETYTINK